MAQFWAGDHNRTEQLVCASIHAAVSSGGTFESSYGDMSLELPKRTTKEHLQAPKTLMHKNKFGKEYSDHDTGLCSHDVSQMVKTFNGKNIIIQKVDLQGNHFESAGIYLGELMCGMPNCKYWLLGHTGLVAKDILGITQILDEMKLDTEEMDLRENALSGAGSNLGKLFLMMPKCKIWDISWSALGPTDIKGIAGIIVTKTFTETKELKLQGNLLAGAGADVGHLMRAVPQARKWDFSNTQMDTRDFTQLAASVGSITLKAETLLVDGSEQYYGDEDKATFSRIMPRCHIQYTNRPRGQEQGEVTTRVEPPHLELTLTDQQVSLPGFWYSVLGLPDQGCVLGGNGAAVMLDARGQETRRYQAYHHDDYVRGLTVHESTLFMIQFTSISRVASFDSPPPPQGGPPAGGDQPAGTTGTVAAVTHYQVPGAGWLWAGLALDHHTLVLVDAGLGTVCRHQLGSSGVHVLVRNLEEPRAISRLGQGDDTTYLVTEEGAYKVRLYSYTWEPLRTIGVHGSGDGEQYHPISACVTPEDTLLVGDRDNRRISEFCLDGTFLSHPLPHLEGEPWNISLQDNHLWLLFPFKYKLHRYTLYQQE